MTQAEEPKVLLDEIIKAVRANKRLDLEFRDEKKQHWILSLKRVEKP